jgi:hypothetical protein
VTSHLVRWRAGDGNVTHTPDYFARLFDGSAVAVGLPAPEPSNVI